MEPVTDLADPQRCQGVIPHGQCMNKAEPGSKNCRAHGGTDLTEQTQMRGYLLAKAQEQTRLTNLSEGLEPVKELRDSIALLHMMVEKRWNLIRTDGDLLQACGPLNQMLQNMERLVSSCHKIEQNLGQLLAKQAILSLAKRMVEVMIEELEGVEDYEAIIDRITTKLFDTIREAGSTGMTTVLTLPTPLEE